MTISDVFEKARAKGEFAFLCYLTAGFPTLTESMRHIATAAASGADIIEVGIPFSDPIADGPTIQHASHVALRSGVTLRTTLVALRELRLETPLIIMSYLNPLLAYGRDALLRDMFGAKVTGLIIPDLPAEESDDWRAAVRHAGVGLIQLAAPTSTDERLTLIGDRSDGFVYAVSVAGITGSRRTLSDGLGAFLERVRKSARKPVAVGFGISTVEQIRSLRETADGVIVGSRLIECIRENGDLGATVRELKAATRS